MSKLIFLLLLFIVTKDMTSQVIHVTYPYVCNPNNRPSVCTMDYVGVCGWNDSTTTCLAYPCAANYATACAACSVPNVEKVTLGNCPAPGSKPPTSQDGKPTSGSDVVTADGNLFKLTLFSIFGSILYLL